MLSLTGPAPYEIIPHGKYVIVKKVGGRSHHSHPAPATSHPTPTHPTSQSFNVYLKRLCNG
jgi:hypothetical protein